MRYSEILVENNQTHLYLAPRWAWPRWNFAEILGTRKLVSGAKTAKCMARKERRTIVQYVRRCLRDPVFSRFGTVPACDI